MSFRKPSTTLRVRQRPATARAAPAEAGARRSWGRLPVREWFESLKLEAQLRVTAVVAVTAALVVAHALIFAWDGLYQRWQDSRAADQLAQSISARLEKPGTHRVFGSLADQPLVLGADVRRDDGKVLERYDAARYARPGESAGRLARWGHATLRFLGLEPGHREYPVKIGGRVTGTLVLVVDNRPPWRAASAGLLLAPLLMACGLLIALRATRAPQRYIVEPLRQLAETTRLGTAGDTPPGDFGGRGNELVDLAANFEALTSRLAAYERDLTNLRVASRKEVADRTREIEERLARNEAAMSAKDEFLANMSHEIRTPMNGVLGMAELLAGTDLDKRQRRYVDSMRSAAETMMQIINDILDDSKIEAGKMDLVRDPFDVREFAEQVGEIFAGRAESKKLELICRVEPTVPAVVIGDVLRLRQVVGNLVSNAVKYTDRGEIVIRIGVDGQQGDRCRLHFSVQDTGPGIAEADQATVFEAFAQIGNAKRIGGTGLGLSIATRLVKLMGGEKIDLWSRPGEGSSFSFVLPFEVHAAAPAPDRAGDEFGGMRVLVVEDNPTSYMQLEEMLSNWSVDVTVLAQGRLLDDKLREAVARRRPFDVVLLDHALPDASTGDLLRVTRMNPATASTWVVLLSAFDYDTAYEGTRAIGPDVCIAKPVRQQSLRSALRAARQARAAPADAAAPAAPGRATAGEGPAAMVSLGLDVLVADDNEINREVAQAMLERCGCRVTIAADGNDACEQAGQRRFDAILMDCQMPGMDGYSAAAAIRRAEAERGSRPTAIVALTANVLARDRNRAIEAGMDRFLAKPFTQEQMVAILRPVAEEQGKLVVLPPPAPSRPVARSVTDTHPVVRFEETEESTDLAPAPDESQFDEPLLSDTVVLKMLEMPSGEADESNRLPVLDASQIAAIRGLGKPQILERLCELMFATAPETLRRLGEALDAGDLEAVAAAAHALKSPVSSLGGRRLAAALERCEEAALTQRDPEATRRAASGLRQTYDDLEAALRAESGLAA
ncbi:MAG TPA: response regulator [Steroidobacteraceae bacterium]|nr:response regulator [Steroidobacteraceae bacterium]